MSRAERTVADSRQPGPPRPARRLRGRRFAREDPGWPEATRSAAFRFTLTERIKRWPSARASPGACAMRSSVGGCVENSLMNADPLNGLMMNMCAVAGDASMGIRCDQPSSFCRAADQAIGRAAYTWRPPRRPRIRAYARSPSGSAWPRSAPESSSEEPPPGCRDSSSSLCRGPNEHRHARQQGDGRGDRRRDRADQDVPIHHVTELVRHHALHFAVVHQPSSPCVNATDEWLGLRPVAKALGECSGITQSRGTGRPIRWQSCWTIG